MQGQEICIWQQTDGFKKEVKYDQFSAWITLIQESEQTPDDQRHPSGFLKKKNPLRVNVSLPTGLGSAMG